MSQKRILIPVDDSESTTHALDHVSRDLAGTDATFRIFHVVGPVPPALLEFGGASDPAEERRIEQELTDAEARWFAGEQEKARPLLERAQGRLVAAGIDSERITVHVAESLPEDRLGHLILDEAREAACDTIVVGRTAYSWLAEKFHRHVGDDLTKHAKGIHVIVVGS